VEGARGGRGVRRHVVLRGWFNVTSLACELGRRDIRVEDVAVNLPFSCRVSLPDNDVFAGVKNTAVGRAGRKSADFVRPVSALLHLAHVHADVVSAASKDAFPSLSDRLSTSHNWRSAIEAELLAGNPDVEGLCQALSDWWAELRILEAEQQEKRSPHAESSPQDREAGG
jgi:hypothetical protein